MKNISKWLLVLAVAVAVNEKVTITLKDGKQEIVLTGAEARELRNRLNEAFPPPRSSFSGDIMPTTPFFNAQPVNGN